MDREAMGSGRALLNESENTALVGNRDIGEAVTVEIGDDEFRAGAGVAVNQVRLETCGVRRGIADKAELDGLMDKAAYDAFVKESA